MSTSSLRQAQDSAGINTSTSPLLEIKDLYVHFNVYGGTLKVLDGVNFTVHSGEKVGLVGETGCGKTTTMKSILRILPMPPARIRGGEIYFKGRDILQMTSSELGRVRGEGMAMIFQDPTAALNPVFTVGKQLEAAVKYSAARDKRLSGKEISLHGGGLSAASLPHPPYLLATAHGEVNAIQDLEGAAKYVKHNVKVPDV